MRKSKLEILQNKLVSLEEQTNILQKDAKIVQEKINKIERDEANKIHEHYIGKYFRKSFGTRVRTSTWYISVKELSYEALVVTLIMITIMKHPNNIKICEITINHNISIEDLKDYKEITKEEFINTGLSKLLEISNMI